MSQKSAWIRGAGPSGLTVFNSELYFYGGNTANGYELWKYDGTSASLVDDIWTGSSSSYEAGVVNMAVYDNALYFAADGNDGKGLELWKYDGGANATLFADINEGPNGSDPDDFLVADGNYCSLKPMMGSTAKRCGSLTAVH